VLYVDSDGDLDLTDDKPAQSKPQTPALYARLGRALRPSFFTNVTIHRKDAATGDRRELVFAPRMQPNGGIPSVVFAPGFGEKR
jgi:hypothetical protein